jgi:hypothetical protein
MNSVPPPMIVAPLAVPPDSTSRLPPLTITPLLVWPDVIDSVWPEPMFSGRASGDSRKPLSPSPLGTLYSPTIWPASLIP